MDGWKTPPAGDGRQPPAKGMRLREASPPGTARESDASDLVLEPHLDTERRSASLFDFSSTVRLDDFRQLSSHRENAGNGQSGSSNHELRHALFSSMDILPTPKSYLPRPSASSTTLTSYSTLSRSTPRVHNLQAGHTHKEGSAVPTSRVQASPHSFLAVYSDEEAEDSYSVQLRRLYNPGANRRPSLPGGSSGAPAPLPVPVPPRVRHPHLLGPAPGSLPLRRAGPTVSGGDIVRDRASIRRSPRRGRPASLTPMEEDLEMSGASSASTPNYNTGQTSGNITTPLHGHGSRDGLSTIMTDRLHFPRQVEPSPPHGPDVHQEEWTTRVQRRHGSPSGSNSSSTGSSRTFRPSNTASGSASCTTPLNQLFSATLRGSCAGLGGPESSEHGLLTSQPIVEAPAPIASERAASASGPQAVLPPGAPPPEDVDGEDGMVRQVVADGSCVMYWEISKTYVADWMLETFYVKEHWFPTDVLVFAMCLAERLHNALLATAAASPEPAPLCVGIGEEMTLLAILSLSCKLQGDVIYSAKSLVSRMKEARGSSAAKTGGNADEPLSVSISALCEREWRIWQMLDYHAWVETAEYKMMYARVVKLGTSPWKV